MTEIRVWAPNVSRVQLVVDAQPEPMTPESAGWWRGRALAPDTDYAFLLGDSTEARPDPASRWQPEGVHGPSRVYDQDAFRWADADWRGCRLDGAVVYELHIGTFTPGATFDSAIERLDHLAELGVTHIELLPVNAVNGVWNWGYDGVGWYAVHAPYGGPDGLKRFVDAAHARGLAVVLDVVYNHLGPSGNYLPEFGPYLKSGRNTWGELVNLEEPAVRRFVIDNALMWLRDYHVDGLRLDAVHALVDSSPTHVLAELSVEVAALSAELGRPLSLIAESDLNDPAMITPVAASGGPPADRAGGPPSGGVAGGGGRGMDAHWDDDVHHALHAALTGERQGYYCDFGPLSVLAKVLTSAFFHDGTYSAFRGRVHGKPVDRATTPGWRFVVFLQNHDQVGNRAVGDRLPELVTPGLLRVGAVLLLTSPFTPMLWMGEEWAASTRWPFFSSHPEPRLAKVTAEGRVAELAEQWGSPRQLAGGPPACGGVAGGGGWDVSQLVDPQDPDAYRQAVLDWDELDGPSHRAMLALYRRLIALRAAEPELRSGDLAAVRVDYRDDADSGERWLAVRRGALHVVANLGEAACTVTTDADEVVLASADGVRLSADGVVLPAESAVILRDRPREPRSRAEA